jgi:hypothetical protein
MDIDAEQTDLCHYAEAHQQRIDHLRARIDRSTRELRVHEMIRDLADNSQLPHALRSLATMPGAELATSRDVRVFLAEYGVSVPAEWDIRVQCTVGDFSVVATTEPERPGSTAAKPGQDLSRGAEHDHEDLVSP